MYLLGFLFLLIWLLARAVLTAMHYFSAGYCRYVCYAFCAGFLIIQAGLYVSLVRNVELESSINTTNNHNDVNESLADCQFHKTPALLPVSAVPVGDATACPLRQEYNQTSPNRPQLVQVPFFFLPRPAARARHFIMKTDLQPFPRKRYVEHSESDKRSGIHQLLLKFYSYLSTFLSQYFASWMFAIW
jgi:hypothetical protein